ncbi:hypothetical protein C2E23DRAFT_38706 [Lenzites betulinus]|nr:hypothetical protein C2E23DRAFT_38706 [Lenzites betulinus]
MLRTRSLQHYAAPIDSTSEGIMLKPYGGSLALQMTPISYHERVKNVLSNIAKNGEISMHRDSLLEQVRDTIELDSLKISPRWKEHIEKALIPHGRLQHPEDPFETGAGYPCRSPSLLHLAFVRGNSQGLTSSIV